MNTFNTKTTATVALWCLTVALGGTATLSLARHALAAEKSDSKTPSTLASHSFVATNSANTDHQGEMLAHTCAACHGTLGRLGDESFMPLAGMPASQFFNTMRDFRSGKRPATLMGYVARGFNDQELQAMAAFFAAQPTAGDQP